MHGKHGRRWIVLVLMVAGCSQEATRPGGSPGTTATIDNVSVDAVLPAAEKALRRHCYEIAAVNYARSTVVTVPLEYTAQETVASVSDVFAPSRHTFRKTATVRVDPSAPNGAAVSVRVDVQRRDTKAMQAFAYQRQGDDRPNNTPAFAAGANREQTEVWTDIRREYSEEQILLDDIRAALCPPAAGK